MAWTQALKDVTLDDVPVVGGKNASLGEMLRELTPLGVNVPDGFAVTAAAYRHFCREAGLDRAIDEELRGLDKRNVDDLVRRAERLRDRIAHAPMPADLAGEIETSYRALSRAYGEDATDVAVRSSATAEDLPGASFAGQQESFLNVRGAASVVEAVRKAFASLFTPRAISYRARHGLRPHARSRSRSAFRRWCAPICASAGVIFTLDPDTGHRGVVLVTSSFGLGESVVQGRVAPDQFYVHKSTLREGFAPARVEEARHEGGPPRLRRGRPPSRCGASPSASEDRARWSLSDDDVLALARWALADRGALLEAARQPTRRWTSSGRRTA